jgi:hypothetical protein
MCTWNKELPDAFYTLEVEDIFINQLHAQAA